MVKCSFCQTNIEKGTGIMFVKKDGKVLNFDKRKIQKNMLKLKRKPAKFKWASKEKKVKK